MDYEKLSTTSPQSRRLSHLPDVFFKYFEFESRGFYPKRS